MDIKIFNFSLQNAEKNINREGKKTISAITDLAYLFDVCNTHRRLFTMQKDALVVEGRIE
jgi:hypothetical protein